MSENTNRLGTVKIDQAIRMVTSCIKAKKVAMIHGSPAIGKSGIVHQIAKEYNLFLIDLRLSQCDPTDLLGFPQIVNGRAGYVPMDTFPIAGDELPVKHNPDGSIMYEHVTINGALVNQPVRYAGWLLFLDEFNSASVAVQAAAYKIILDRMVGKFHLHKNVAVVAAGNLETDGAIVEQMSTALQSRIVHMDLVVDVDLWIKWATQNDIDHRIISFMNFKPALIYTFKPDHSDRTYAAPRTWAFADSFLKILDIKDPDMLPLLSGSITMGVAHEFKTFCEIYDKLPTMADLIAAPKQVMVSLEPGTNFAITGMIAHNATATSIDPLMEYVIRLPIEFQIVCLRMLLTRRKELNNSAAVQKWVAENALNLF